MYYPCSENKGADQLRGYREADLRLCFRLCKLLVFSCTGSIFKKSTVKKDSSFCENLCSTYTMKTNNNNLLTHIYKPNVLSIDLTLLNKSAG